MELPGVAVVVCVCSEDYESDRLSLEKKDYIYLIRMSVVEAELTDCCNCAIYTC